MAHRIDGRKLSRKQGPRLALFKNLTVSVIRYEKSGHLSFAGAHEEIVVYRVAEGRAIGQLAPAIAIGLPSTRTARSAPLLRSQAGTNEIRT